MAGWSEALAEKRAGSAGGAPDDISRRSTGAGDPPWSADEAQREADFLLSADTDRLDICEVLGMLSRYIILETVHGRSVSLMGPRSDSWLTIRSAMPTSFEKHAIAHLRATSSNE